MQVFGLPLPLGLLPPPPWILLTQPAAPPFLPLPPPFAAHAHLALPEPWCFYSKQTESRFRNYDNRPLPLGILPVNAKRIEKPPTDRLGSDTNCHVPPPPTRIVARIRARCSVNASRNWGSAEEEEQGRKCRCVSIFQHNPSDTMACEYKPQQRAN